MAPCVSGPSNDGSSDLLSRSVAVTANTLLTVSHCLPSDAALRYLPTISYSCDTVIFGIFFYFIACAIKEAEYLSNDSYSVADMQATPKIRPFEI
jgi:hypothetical protein